MFVTSTTEELLVGSPQEMPVSSARWMVTPTWVVTAQGSASEVKVRSGLATTSQDTSALGVVVLVEVGMLVEIPGLLTPPDGVEDVLQAASRLPAMAAASHPWVLPTPRVSHRPF
jgi:hypothetical protein